MRPINRFMTFVSLALLALVVACGGGGSSPAPAPPAPTITSFTSDKSILTQGGSASLTAVYANGAGSVAPGVGAMPSGQAIAVLPSLTTTYILTVTNAANATATRSLTINVVPAPTISSFSASKSAISPGESVAITADFSGGTAIVSNNVNATTFVPVNAVPQLVSPAATTTYTLTVTNPAGTTITKGIVISVQGVPSINSFSATPATISLGNSATLNYTFSGGTGSINHGVGPVASGLSTAVSPTLTTTYVLTVTNAVGSSVFAAATVAVTGFPSNVSLTAERPTITEGESTRLTATFNSGNAAITNNQNGASITPGSGIPITVTPPVTTSYVLTVTNSAGGTSTAVATITVVPAPVIIGFQGSPSPITVGESSNLIASFANGTASINNGVGPVQSGVPVRVSPAVTTSYLLTVTNTAGMFIQRSVTITVAAAPVGISLVAIPPVITIGASSSLIATFSNGTGNVNNGVGNVNNGVPVVVAPIVTTTYTLTVTNDAGATATVGCTVTVVLPPSITSFTSLPPTTIATPVAAGSPVQLLPVFINGTGVIGGIGSVVSGNSYVVNPTVTTTYTLTVTNAAGQAVTAILTVHVIMDPVITSFTAAPNPITAGQTTQLTGIFSGDIPGGTAIVNPGAIAMTSGIPITVGPLLVNTTYTLTVTNIAAVSVNRSVTVVVIGAPAATSLVAVPAVITVGETSMLTPTFTGGTGTITPGITGPVLSGSAYAVNPTQTTTYTLAVTNPLGIVDLAIATVTVLTGPNAAALTATPGSITLGDTSYLKPYFTIGTGGAASVICTSPNAATSGLAVALVVTAANAVPFPVTPSAIGSYVYTLTVTNSAGVTTTHGATVNVYGLPTAALAITAGSSNPITVGGSTSLTPTFTNGVGVISGIGTVTSAQAYPVSPIVTTTYVLTVTNPVGATATASITVVVLAGPFAQAFYFLPNIITEGSTSQLYAIWTNAVTATIASNAGALLAPSALANGAFFSGTPIPVTSAPSPSAGIFTYTLSVTNAALTTYTTTANITVVPAPTAVLNVTSPAGPAPYTITAGQSATLQSVFTNGLGAINQGVGPVVNGSSYVVTPLVSTTYTLTVTNAAGAVATDSETIFVVAGPFAQALMSDKLIATAGTTIYLTAVFNLPPLPAPPATATVDNTTAGADTGLPRVSPILQTGVPFAVALDAGVTSDRIYRLTVANGAGVSHTTGLLVKIVAAPTNVLLTMVPASPAAICLGGSITLTPSWTGGPDCVGVLSGGGMSQTVVSGVTYTFNPVASTSYVLTVTNGAGTSVSSAAAIVTVNPPPSIGQFDAIPNTITVGGASSLLAVFTGGTGSVSAIPAVAGFPQVITSGIPLPTGVLPTNTTFILTVTSGSGCGIQVRNTVVTVVPAPVCTITAEAGPIVEGTIGHTASVPAQPGSTYSWVITGGSITAGQGTNLITYTAGAAPGPVTLTATVTNAAGASCTTAPATSIVVSAYVPMVPALSSSAAPTHTITLGSSTNLLPTWVGGAAPFTATINNGVGAVISGQAYTVAPTVTTNYILSVTDATGANVLANLTITVVQPVSITSFTASRNPVTVGTVTFLTAVFSNPTPAVGGNEITHPDAAGSPPSPIVPTSGSIIPYIPGTLGPQLHTLTETNLAGQTVTRTILFDVLDAPVAMSLVAVPTTISAGQSSTLTPTFTDGTGAVNNGVGTVISAAGYPVTPAVTTTYTLTVTNAAGDTAIQQATVTVLAGPNAISLSANRPIITLGEQVTLSANFSNGTAVLGLTGSAGSGPELPATPVPGIPVVVTPTTTGVKTYSLLVTGAGGVTSLATVNVTVVAAPTASLVTNPVLDTITAGTSTFLDPGFTGSALGTATINNGVGTVVDVPAATTYQVFPPATTVYTLTVTNAAGAAATAQRTITVLSGPLATSFTATPNVITAGQTTSLLAIFSGPAGTLGSVDNGVGAILSGVPLASAALATTTTFTLTVTSGTLTVIRTATVVVVAAPSGLLLTATPAIINQGQTSVLVPTFLGGTGTVTSGVGTVVSGASYNVAPGSTTTYTLIVTNAAGTIATTTATVTVLVAPFGSSFTASPGTISVGDTIFLNWVFNTPITSAEVLMTDDAGTVSTIVPTMAPSPGTTTITPLALTVPPFGLYSFTLRLTNGTITQDTTRVVNVWDLPTAVIAQTAPGAGDPSPDTEVAGANVTLSFTFTGNSTGRVIDGIGNTWTVSSGSTIIVVTPPVGITRTYTLTVGNPAGTLASDTYRLTGI